MKEEKKENILEKLSNVQNELKVPKNQKNNFGNYNYRSAEDILEAVKPLLKTNRLSLILSDELKNIGDRYYINAIATIYDLDSEKTISNTAYAREEETKKGMDGSQITGTASSYARKYALNGLFNIDDTKDADTDEYQKQTNKVEAPKKVSLATMDQIERIKKALNEEQIKVALDLVKKEKLEDLTIVEASSLIKKIGGEK
jgi:predicted lipoprotein